MPSEKPKLLVIVGPTASGKSELAVRLAKKLNGEIISADSRQIYRGLNIGTAKVAGQWRKPHFGGSTSKTFIYKTIPHHCIDFVSPKKTFSAAEYKQCAKEAIRDIRAAGKLPILVGGAGFWIDAVVHDFALPDAPPNQKLRNQLGRKSPAELLALLTRLDPKRGQTIEQKNPRRLIRAIELARALGEVPPLKKRSPYQTLWIGIQPDAEVLARRIRTRSRAMARRGLAREVKNLLEKKISKKRIREFGFEYRLGLEAREGRISKREFAERLTRETLRYARRQMRWWKKNRAIRWVKHAPEALILIPYVLRQNKR